MPEPKHITAITDPEIKAAFDGFPDDVRPQLLALRQQIFTTAAILKKHGHVTETLKWQQPSYQIIQPKSGTPIRLGVPKSKEGHYGLYVHCQTRLIESVSLLYPDDFLFEGTRALIINKDRTYPKKAIEHVIAMTLTYHRS